MKTFFALALVTLCIFALCNDAYASPSSTDATKDAKPKETIGASKDVKDAIKNAKDAKKSKKECVRDCGIAHDPICVHDPSSTIFKPRTFGSQCVLDVHNCEMGTKLVMKSKGECPGSQGVKL